jgi:hypothetical protein
MNRKHIGAGLAALALPAAVLTTQLNTADASTVCGDNYYSVGRGPAPIFGGETGSQIGTVDIQFNANRQRWCFVVRTDQQSVATIQGRYGSRTDGWNVYQKGWGTQTAYLDSNGGKCADARGTVDQAEGEYGVATIDRCRV